MAELTSDATATSSCCPPEAQADCCEPSDKAECCDVSAAGGSCGCSAGEQPVIGVGEPKAAVAVLSSATSCQLELFEPAMCCQSGVCGPSVDQQLIDVREDLRWAESRGAQVTRHNLSSDPDAFVANAKVTGLMAAFGEPALPVLVVDGDIAIHGRYPSRSELAALLGAAAMPGVELPQSSVGCGCAPGEC